MIFYLIGFFVECSHIAKLQWRQNIFDVVGAAVIVIVVDIVVDVGVGRTAVVHLKELVLSLQGSQHLSIVGVVK